MQAAHSNKIYGYDCTWQLHDEVEVRVEVEVEDRKDRPAVKNSL
jgi:hypothetical protein